MTSISSEYYVEENAEGKMLVFISPTMFPWGMETLIGKLDAADMNTEFKDVVRPVYDLVFVEQDRNKILHLIQESPNQVKRQYKYTEFGSQSRLYVEKTQTSLSIFMVSIGNDSDLEDFGRIITA